MEFSSDQFLKLARSAYQSKRWEECLRYLTRCNDAPEAQGLRSLASYEIGKALAAKGSYADARAAFSKAAVSRDGSRTDILAQERSHLINEVLAKRTRPASVYVPVWQEAKTGAVVALPPASFQPDIWLEACR